MMLTGHPCSLSGDRLTSLLVDEAKRLVSLPISVCGGWYTTELLLVVRLLASFVGQMIRMIALPSFLIAIFT